jgi:hypothetical protein
VKLPSPDPSSTDTSPEPTLAAARSFWPSPFRSTITTAAGRSPAGQVVAVANVMLASADEAVASAAITTPTHAAENTRAILRQAG